MADNTKIFDPGFRVLDTSGNPAASATIEFYDAGTSDARTVYSDNGLSTSLGSTVTCNSAGEPSSDGSSVVSVYTGTTDYKVIIKDSTGATLGTYDNQTGALDTSSFSNDTAVPTTAVIAKSANYTILSTDQGKVIDADATGGSFTLTLPSAVTVGDAWRVTVKATGTGSGAVTVAATGGQTVDGVLGSQDTSTQFVLSYQYEAITLVSDGANWHIAETARYHVPGWSSTPQGRLTLTSATPVLSSDTASATTVYYTPYVGEILPFYTGQRFIGEEFAELSLTLVSQHTAGGIFDVFAFKDSATQRIGTGPVWGTLTAGSGARGTGAGTTELERVDGLWTNKVSMTARNGTSTYTVDANKGTYLGSIYVDSGAAGQVTHHVSYGQSRKAGVWNAYNRVPIILKAGDGTNSWTYTTATLRASNGDSTNSLTTFSGLLEEYYDVMCYTNVSSSTNQLVSAGVGWNSTSALSGLGSNAHSAASKYTLVSSYAAPPNIGLNVATSLEYSTGGGTTTWYGDEAGLLLIAKWMG